MSINPVISMMITLELVGFWIILFYNTDRESYMVNLTIGASIMLIMVNMYSWLSIMLLMLIFPLVSGYLRMMSGVISGIYLNESVNKALVLTVVVGICLYMNELMYLSSFLYMAGGVLGSVLCGVYVFIMLGSGLWVLLLFYLAPNIGVNDNYRVLTVGVLPMIAFFVNICSIFLVIWFTMVNAMMILL